MKKKAIFITALLVGFCAVNLYSYRKELGLYWREWSSFQRHYIPFNSQAQLHQPILSRSVSKQDPEAAAIVEFIYKNYTDMYRDVFMQHIERLSGLSEKYPTNPYFLYEIACRLADGTYVDPQVIDRIADQLIEIDPNNGRYYFLKAMAIFYDWGDNRVEEALAYLDKGFSCSTVQDPYDLYRKRACELVEKDKMTALLSGMPAEWQSRDGWILHQFRQDLLTYTQDLIVNSQLERAKQIHDQFQRIAEKSLVHKMDWFAYPLIASKDIGTLSMADQVPQGVELKWMRPETERFQQNRMQLRAWKQWHERYQEARNKPIRRVHREEYPAWKKINIPPAAHSFQITLAAFIAFLFFGTVGIIFKVQRSRFSRWVFVLAPLSMIGYFALCRWGDYGLMYTALMCDHYAFYDVPISMTNFIFLCMINYCAKYPYLLWLLIPATCILAWVFIKKEARFGWFRKLIVRLLAIILILALWSAWNRLKLGALGLDVLVLTFLLPVLCFRRKDRKAGIYYGLFSRSAEAMQYRWRCLVLCGSVVLIHLAVFAMFASSLANFANYSIQERNRYRDYYGLAISVPQYTIDPNNYVSLLSEFNTAGPWDTQLPGWVVMVEPGDIPEALTTLKERRKNDPNGYWGGMGMPGMPPKGMPSIGEQTPKTPDPNQDYLAELRYVVAYCGKDALPYIKPFLRDPNVIESLAIRECDIPFVGRDVLIGQWRSQLDAWRSDPNGSLGMDCAQAVFLKAISQFCPYPHFPMGEYPFMGEFPFIKNTTPKSEMEIGAFSNYLLEGNICGRIDDDVMKYLNRRQKGEVLAAAAALFSEKRLCSYRGQCPLQYNVELDAATQERLWKELFENCDKLDSEDGHEYQTLNKKPFDYHISDELLMSCMNSENVCLRAMGQHIFRKLGKTPDEELLKRWANDSSPVVRAGAAWAEPTLQEIAKDSSAFVRLVGGLGSEEGR